ncbi:MAG: CapA family protein [bacterium]|nr:CapA family protein [bacterium]
MKWALVPIILGIILFFGISFFIEPAGIEIIPSQQKETSTLIAEEEQPIKIILVGDIMLDRGVEYMVEKEGGGDFRFPFLKIADYLKGADIVFGNLEGVISDKGIKVGSIYSFRANPKAIEGLIFAGFNVLSLANNHAFDYGREALEDCLAKLSNAGIGYAGAGFTGTEAYSPFVKEIGDTKIGFLAYTNLGPGTWRAAGENSGIAWISENDFDKIKKDIENAKSQADILIVSLHAGEEYQKTPTQFQIEFFEIAIDAGADLVVDHHSHVVQHFEKYQNGWIFYSLGNFIFDQSFSEETMKGQILEVLIQNKQIKKVITKETKINNFFQPEVLTRLDSKINLCYYKYNE